jgi:DNA polymerase III subunit delta
MKLEKAVLTAALKNWPQELRAAVIFGPDEALMRERADKIGRQIVADLRDPFNVVELTDDDLKSDPARLADEAASLSMMGGRRLVRVSGDTYVQEPLTNALSQNVGDAMIVVQAGDLKKDNKFRKWAEAAPGVAAIICYAAEARDMTTLLREEARAAGYAIDDEAVGRIIAASGNERDIARRELEKTILYVGTASRNISGNDVIAITASRGSADSEALTQAVMSDDGRAADAQIARLVDENVSGIGLMGAISRRLSLMLAAHAHLEEGGAMEEFNRRAFGPMAWKQGPLFTGQLGRWPIPRVQRALTRLLRADQAAKLSGAKNTDVLAGQAILGLVRGR